MLRYEVKTRDGHSLGFTKANTPKEAKRNVVYRVYKPFNPIHQRGTYYAQAELVAVVAK